MIVYVSAPRAIHAREATTVDGMAGPEHGVPVLLSREEFAAYERTVEAWEFWQRRLDDLAQRPLPMLTLHQATRREAETDGLV
jgi:hypothetical protein